ncbi:MAG: HAD family hydrolase [Candidatus Heimdallarchaeum aukensis]|uniref:HAD family hydrolase n=1 Tax=Candidatus Heimdallarchaeum aukensis TaxID=2876573 RepID=A0A9Y1BMR3_9ARCH|nr:MAG: HAD family hydrolase [Candidatus Heimdallarchaeum aukensis]
MIKVVIFDFDGVISDSKRAYALQMQETIKKISGKDISISEFDKRGGNTDQIDDFKHLLQTEDRSVLDKASKIYQELTVKYKNMRKLYPGVKETLKKVREMCKIAIVSRKEQNRLIEWINFYSIGELIDKAIGTLDHSKAPAIKRVLEEFNCQPEEALMVGDTAFDIVSAKEAKVRSVLAKYGTTMYEEAVEQKPDFIIDSISEIITLINQLNNEE